MGRDNEMHTGREDAEMVEVTPFKGFHFMLPEGYIVGMNDLEVSVEYKSVANSIMAWVWVRRTERPRRKTRYNVDVLAIDAPPDDEVVERLLEAVNASENFRRNCTTIYGPDEPEA